MLIHFHCEECEKQSHLECEKQSVNKIFVLQTNLAEKPTCTFYASCLFKVERIISVQSRGYAFKNIDVLITRLKVRFLLIFNTALSKLVLVAASLREVAWYSRIETQKFNAK